MNDYNTQRPTLILKEYGRNIQKLVEFVKKTEDQEKRNEYANILVELMKQLSPMLKETQETNQKLWDDIYIMANFDISIESPYPVPSEEVLNKKPKKLDYNVGEVRYKHYGRNICLMIDKAKEIEDKEEQKDSIIYIGKLMKNFYNIWNRENADEETIVKNIKELSKGTLDIDVEEVKKHRLFDSNIRERDPIKENRENRPKNIKRQHRGNQNRRRRK